MPLSEAIGLENLSRGVLTPIKTTRDGKRFFCLQYTRNGRHVSRYVPEGELEAYREATANYRILMDAVDAHVDRLTAETARRIREEAARQARK